MSPATHFPSEQQPFSGAGEPPGVTAPILVGLALRDDDAAPLALGRLLARAMGAPLALVTAIGPAPAHLAAGDVGTEPRDATLDELEARRASLPEPRDVMTDAQPGPPARVLNDAARRLAAGVIVVGSSHRGRLGRVLAGSVTDDFLHGLPCAIAVAPRGYTGDRALARIAVAYDGSAEARDALAVAVALAVSAGGRVHIFTLVEPLDQAPALSSLGWTYPGAYQERRRAHAEALVREAWGELPPAVRGDAEVLDGPARTALIASSPQFDLLVTGSHGHGAFGSAALGGVSRDLIHRVACPVLVIPRATRRRHDLGVLTR